jgi:hypothetical protein
MGEQVGRWKLRAAELIKQKPEEIEIYQHSI